MKFKLQYIFSLNFIDFINISIDEVLTFLDEKYLGGGPRYYFE
jgi:hypothetical protein